MICARTVNARDDNKNVQITEFEGRIVNYGPRFSPSIYGPSAKRSTDREKEVSKIFIISLNRR